MKLSKQERIAAIVVVVLIILVAGVFLFIKPNFETISETKKTLSAKEQEYKDAVNKAEQMEPLKTSILDAYNKGKNMANRFYPELPSYEADKKFREFLSTCKANVLIEDLEVTVPATVGLSSYVFVPTEVQYPLKDYANQGKTSDIDPRLIRQAALQLILGEAQTVGATTISFTLHVASLEDLLTFADEVNNYTVTENGESVRKTIELDNITYVDVMNSSGYDALAQSIIAQAEPEAAKLFEEKTGFKLSGYSQNTSSSNNNNNNNNDNNGTPAVTPAEGEGEGDTPTISPAVDTSKGVPLNYYLYSMPCQITFYSVESMQDPTPVLNIQDKSVNDAS